MKGTIPAVLFLLCLLIHVYCASTVTKSPTTCLQGSPGLPGRNGVNGHNGLPGRDGRDGAKGEKGAAGPPGASGVTAEAGPSGNDTNQRNWKQCVCTKGGKGVAGSPGPRGFKGEKGVAGFLGPRGAKGERGVAGSPGPRGFKGVPGPRGKYTDHRNWKQCVWRSDDNRDIGLIKDCQFTKTKDDTALRVVYQGNIYLRCYNCCKRWFITFNGAECSGPLPIDIVLWMHRGGSGYTQHRPGSVEGYCDNIHKGKIRVGINIGNCRGYGNANGHTGWNSVSRLMIEEAPRSQ